MIDVSLCLTSMVSCSDRVYTIFICLILTLLLYVTLAYEKMKRLYHIYMENYFQQESK